MGGSDKSAEEHPSREEIVAQHEPIHTYPRPSRDPVGGGWRAILWAWAAVCGVIAGLILPMVWLLAVAAALGWLLPHGRLTSYVILLIPPVILIGWAALRERERQVWPATKVFLGTALFAWLFFVFGELWIVY